MLRRQRRDPVDERIRLQPDAFGLGQSAFFLLTAFAVLAHRQVRHWRDVVPERMIDVQSEELVTGTETVLRAVPMTKT